MDLLVIGGGRFVGRAIVEAALAAGHRVSTFNRGSQPPAPGVRALHGDRRSDLSALQAGRWDAVIDVCAYLPGEVRALSAALRGRCARQVFISSVSVYADHAQPRQEGDALAALERWAEAETSYTEAIALLPDDAGLHYCRGLVLRRLGRLTDALASLERAAALASELAAAHGERAQVLQALGRLPDALAAHRRVTELNPDNAEAYYNLGLVEQTMGHLAEAIA